MAEITLDLRTIPKADAYTQLAAHIDTILEDINDEIAEMATISALLHHAFGFLWTGFYRVAEPNQLLRVGPYQGALGCLEITFGKGVCGTAAARRETIIVHDVDQFPGHIACDVHSRSEIVVPVTNSTGDLLAVLDIDSEYIGTFTDEDKTGLTKIVARFAREHTTNTYKVNQTV